MEFLDAQRASHRGKIEFTSLFSGVDPQVSPEVSYDPKDPSRFVLSWAVHTATGRWMASMLFVLMGPLLGFGSLMLAQGHLRKARLQTAAS